MKYLLILLLAGCIDSDDRKQTKMQNLVIKHLDISTNYFRMAQKNVKNITVCDSLEKLAIRHRWIADSIELELDKFLLEKIQNR